MKAENGRTSRALRGLALTVAAGVSLASMILPHSHQWSFSPVNKKDFAREGIFISLVDSDEIVVPESGALRIAFEVENRRREPVTFSTRGVSLTWPYEGRVPGGHHYQVETEETHLLPPGGRHRFDVQLVPSSWPHVPSILSPILQMGEASWGTVERIEFIVPLEEEEHPAGCGGSRPMR